MAADLDAAERAIRSGDLVVYPTETVYGLGTDALDPAAIERVYEAKHRPRDRPVSLAVPTVAVARRFIQPDHRTTAFMEAFLPGPVTVVAPKTADVPGELTGHRPRVGVRVPDHPMARSLLERVAPLTATSANVSGTQSVRNPADFDPELRAAVTVVLDDGWTPGGGSTVVDPAQGVIHRRGRQADAVESWLADRE